MCLEDGSSLPVVGYLRWSSQLQAIPPVSNLHIDILLGLFRRRVVLDMDRDLGRHPSDGDHHAGERGTLGRHRRHYRAGAVGVHRVAYQPGCPGHDHNRMLGEDPLCLSVAESAGS